MTRPTIPPVSRTLTLVRGFRLERVRRNRSPTKLGAPRRSDRREYFFDTSNYPTYKSDFNSSAVCRRAGQDVPDDPLGQLARRLVLLLDDAHTRSRFYAGTSAVVKDPQTIWGPSCRPRAGPDIGSFLALGRVLGRARVRRIRTPKQGSGPPPAAVHVHPFITPIGTTRATSRPNPTASETRTTSSTSL